MKILVCGTNYGATYIRALALATSGVKLGGILSTGSRRSREYARQHSVDHYTALDQLDPGNFDIACVAVAGTVGQQLAAELMQMGLHVIIEHPLGEAQACRLLEIADAQNPPRQLFINAHFADLQAPGLFLNSLSQAAAQYPLMHLSIDVNLRTIYSALDVIGRIWNRLDHFEVIPLRPADQQQPAAFEMLGLRSGPFMAHLLVQNYSSPRDDGSATLLNHRISACFQHGNLLLAETTGPVLWYPTITSMPQDAWSCYLPIDLSNYNLSTLQMQRDQANLNLIYKMMNTIQSCERPAEQQPDYLLSLTRLWDQVLTCLQPQYQSSE